MKALSFVSGAAAGPIDPSYDYTSFTEVVRSAEDAYHQAGITDRGRSWRWPRSDHASRRPNRC